MSILHVCFEVRGLGVEAVTDLAPVAQFAALPVGPFMLQQIAFLLKGEATHSTDERRLLAVGVGVLHQVPAVLEGHTTHSALVGPCLTVGHQMTFQLTLSQECLTAVWAFLSFITWTWFLYLFI